MLDPVVLADEVFHYVLVPLTVYTVTKVRSKYRQDIREVASEVAKQAAQEAADKLLASKLNSEVFQIVDKMLEERMHLFETMIRNATDDLYKRINGTYLRSEVGKLLIDSVSDRINGVERRLENVEQA